MFLILTRNCSHVVHEKDGHSGEMRLNQLIREFYLRITIVPSYQLPQKIGLDKINVRILGINYRSSGNTKSKVRIPSIPPSKSGIR